MRKNFGAKDFMPPMPVLIIGTYDEEGKPNAMNAAWGGMCRSNPLSLNVFLTEDHKTTKNIKAVGDFTIHIAAKSTMAESDYVGIVSGNAGDKMEATGWKISKAENVNAPVFEDFPIVIECKAVEIDERSRVVGEIVNTSVDEAFLDEAGMPDVDKMEIISYEPIHHTYRLLGEVLGDAFSIGRTVKK